MDAGYVSQQCEHDFIEKVSILYIKSLATCTNPMTFYKSCSKCGERSSETFTTGVALNHKLSIRIPIGYVNRKSEATCTEPAVYYKYCLMCKKILTKHLNGEFL